MKDKYALNGLTIALIGLILFLYIWLRPLESFQTNTPTFHILIATGGRPSLKNMLDSLKDELTENDAITIVFDGPDAQEKSGYNETWLHHHKANIKILTQTPNLGAGIGGEPIRTKYQTQLSPRTTFIMHADDDDQYIPNSFNTLRQLCTDPNTLYFAKMNYSKYPERIVPTDNTIRYANIGTPNGIIPFDSAGKAEWGMRYGGDFDYYNALQGNIDKNVFLDTIIYTVN